MNKLDDFKREYLEAKKRLKQAEKEFEKCFKEEDLEQILEEKEVEDVDNNWVEWNNSFDKEENHFKEVEAKNDNPKSVPAYISPNGEWFNVALVFHLDFAYNVATKRYNKECEPHKAKDILYNKGWILITQVMMNSKLINYQNMTTQQYNTLKDFFGGDIVKGNGKTINEMYYANRN